MMSKIRLASRLTCAVTKPFQAVLVVLFSISAIAVAEQAKAPPIPSARIGGTILDGITNKPVAGVAVSMLQGTDRRDSMTDASGQFAFTATHGTVRLVTSKAGYASVRPEGHKLPTDGVLISLTPGQQLRNLTLHIWPTGSLTGTVYDSKSKPVQYARAQLMRYMYDEDGQRILTPAGSGRGGETNDHGEFRISDVDPGDYDLQVDPPVFAERVPGEPFTPLRPTTAAVKSGAETHIADLTLPSVRGVTMRLRLLNRTGQSVQNTMMKYLHWNRRNDLGVSIIVPLLILGGPERAEIPVPIGIYSVTAGWMTGGSPDAQPVGLGNTIVEAGQNNADVEIVVKRGVRITGQAVMEQPKGAPRPVSGVRCDFSSDAFPALHAGSIQDGSISIDNVQKAVYRMTCSSPTLDSYITGIKQGDRDVLKQGLEISDGGEIAAFTVSFSPSGATIEGSVLGDAKNKAGGALVALVPDDPLRNAKYLYRATNADQNGAFSLKAVAPGAYHVFAWTELEGAAYKNDEFMKQYAEQGTAIKVAPAEKKAGVETKLLN
jgi:hypothetical protein